MEIFTSTETIVRRETFIENKQFKETKTLISHAYLIIKSFQGYRLNRTVSALHGVSLKLLLQSL